MAPKKPKRPLLMPGWAIYLRTSSEEAQAPERSQTSQRRLIVERLVNGSHLALNEEYADTFTGRSTDREHYQRLLADARQGKFSHVGIAFVDRFGRNDVEGIRAFDELTALGIKTRIATYPSLDPATPDGRMVVGLLFSVARFESDRTGQRAKEGMLTKLLEGGWSFRAPEGYLNREVKANVTGDRADKLKNARYKRWVELDPEAGKLWRLAWQLLLSERYTLEQICEELHSRGYTLTSGAPFVRVTPAERRDPNVGALSRAFHNWFYAGWVVVKNDWANIPPKTIQGNWEAVVTTEEFERGLSILHQRNQHRNQQKQNFYLLQGMIYLLEPNGVETRLISSTSNTQRGAGKGTSYYCVRSSNLNFHCQKIDTQVADWLTSIQLDSAYLPQLRAAFTADLDHFLKGSQPTDRADLEAKLNALQEYEKTLARKNAQGMLSDQAYTELWHEFKDQQTRIRNMLDSMEQTRAVHLANLDDALSILANLGILYRKLEQHAQKDVLKHIVKRVVINSEGKVVRLDLRPPFTYLCQLVIGGAGLGQGGYEIAQADLGKNNANSHESACSAQGRLGVPNLKNLEQNTSLQDLKVLFYNAISFPQRSRLERYLTAS